MPLPGPLVIYVEHDNPVVEQTLLEFLTDLGNTAVAIRSADELRAKLNAVDPKADVLLTSLCNGDGTHFLQQMHQQHPKLALFLILPTSPQSNTASNTFPNIQETIFALSDLGYSHWEGNLMLTRT